MIRNKFVSDDGSLHSGVIGEYLFNATVAEAPIEKGIREGKVTKLEMWQGDKKPNILYDEKWVKHPRTVVEHAFVQEVLDNVEGKSYWHF